jgi:death-on-curing protein
VTGAEPLWLSVEEVLAFHDLALARFGGSPGLRDLGLLESALDRPRNVFAYEGADLCTLAATYGEALAKNHPFIDGNKRTAFTCLAVFLEKNGYELRAPEAEVVAAMLHIADGSLPRAGLAKWVKDNVHPPPEP